MNGKGQAKSRITTSGDFTLDSVLSLSAYFLIYRMRDLNYSLSPINF